MIKEKIKSEQNILIMLAFFSISQGIWENFKQLWLQSNNMNVTQISKILSFASIMCAVILILFANKISLNKIKSVLNFCVLMKIITLIRTIYF